LSIDTESGVLSFLPACRCRITLRQPIALRKFSSIYWRGGGNCYSVELVNPRGEDKVLHVFASEAAVEQLCRFISKQFGLRNRGYMG